MLEENEPPFLWVDHDDLTAPSQRTWLGLEWLSQNDNFQVGLL